MNCTPENPCVDCDNGRLIRRMTERLGEIAAQRDILLAAARRALNARNADEAFRMIEAAIAQVERK